MGLTVDQLHIQGGGADATGKILGAKNKYGEVKWGTPGDFGVMVPPAQTYPSWLCVASALFTSADGIGTWFLGHGDKIKSGVAGSVAADLFRWETAWFPVAGKPVLTLAMRISVNGVAPNPGVSVTGVLREVAIGGNANQITYTSGAESTTDSNHQVAATSLAAGTHVSATKTITKPNNDANYAVAIQLAGAWNAGSALAITAGVHWSPY